MVALINHDAWDVSDSGFSHLEGISDLLEAEELGPVLEAFREIAKPRWTRLEGEDGHDSELLNSRLQRFLMVVARDQDMRAPMAAKAAARVGMDGAPDPAAVDAAELETVLSIGVQDLGQPFFDKLMELALASEDRAFRNDALGALARAEDPALAAKLQDLILSGQLQGYEPLFMMTRQMARAATTDLTHAWLLENNTAVFALIPEQFRARVIAGLGAFFCSNEQADEWEAYILQRADELPGYERPLAQATETARLCAALREESALDLVAALTARNTD